MQKRIKFFTLKAKGIGKSVVYVGSKTGRDGIHGASMASANLMKVLRIKSPQCKWAIHSLKNYY